jgi:hypothetical protein
MMDESQTSLLRSEYATTQLALSCAVSRTLSSLDIGIHFVYTYRYGR